MAKELIKAKKLGLYIDGILVGCATDVSVTLSVAEDEATCIDSGDWAESAPGELSWEASLSGNSRIYTTPDAATNKGVVDLMDMAIAKTIFEVALAPIEGTGKPGYLGKGYLNNVEWSGSVGGVSTYTAGIRGTGPLAKITTPVEEPA